ncbi:Uncharacterized protein HDE_04327 [Halotydeus destructor]|nr:Uncharacterized protein HDE_04327 [Halotydeus destructor]
MDKKKRPEPEVVVFQTYKSKRKPGTTEEKSSDSTKQFDFKRARHEVFRFGMSGMEKEDKVSANEALLIRLGAKPEKKRPVNYKVLMEQRKAERKQEIEEKEQGNVRFKGTGIAGSSRAKVVKKRNPNAPRGGIDYQVGKFKDGVLKVKKHQLKSRRK